MKCKKSASRLLGTSVGEIGMILTMEQVFLTENPRGMYNQQGLYYAYAWQRPYLHEGEVQSMSRLLTSIKYQLFLSFHSFQRF